MRIFLTVALLLLPTHIALADAVDDVVQQRMKNDKIPGVIVAIEDQGSVQLRTYGVADLETGAPIEENSIFEYASITKGLTGTAFMTLVQEGEVSADEPIVHYLHGPPRSWKPITMRHALTHSSGLPDLLIVLSQVGATEPMSGEDQLHELVEHDATGTPGKAFTYNNTGPFVIGRIIEAVSRRTYEDYLRQSVLEPAGMESVQLISQTRETPGMVSIYTLRDGEHVPWSLTANVGLALDNSWSGTQGTAGDLVRFAQAFRARKLLNDDSIERMLDGELVTPSGSVVGLGWFVRQYNGERAIAHEGHTGTAFVAFTDRPTTFVVLTNLAKGNQWPFGSDRGHSARQFMEAVIEAWFEETAAEE